MKVVIGFVVAIALVSGIWYMSNSSKNGGAENGMEDSSSTKEEVMSVGSVSELAAKGGQYKCTFSIVDPNADSSGTVYIDGKKFRGDFTSTVKAINQTVSTHSLSDGAYSYTWTENTNTGFKVPVISTGSGSGAMSGTMDFSAFGAQGNWQCAGAKFDETTFAIPANINFIESPAQR